MASEFTETGTFSIKGYKRYRELPFNTLDDLPFSVYIIDYDWVYLFLNRNSRNVFGEFADMLIGKSALEVFKDPKFLPIFEKIRNGVETKSACSADLYSPLRGKQIKITGYPLEDCYYFSTLILPAKEELIEELRIELKRKKPNDLDSGQELPK